MLNMNFSLALTINTNHMKWEPSPIKGVWRKKLARENFESGHATSVVKYEAGARFSQHDHPGGEEILVLKGIFSDHTGDYPAGSYLRNPLGFKHSPFSQEGCEIFVKLHQIKPEDKAQVRIDMTATDWVQGQGNLKVMPLHSFQGEHVALVKWPAGEVFLPHKHFGGEEVFVLSGTFKDEHGDYPAGTWIRSPHQSQHHPFVTEDTIIWVKTGHLPLY